jgi:hypothetical protein
MSYNHDTLWRLYNIGGADLALRYAELALSTQTTPGRSLSLAKLSCFSANRNRAFPMSKKR